MDLCSNTIIANIQDGRKTQTKSLYQYNYGQILKIIGVELPETYEVHFSNTRGGEATTSLGNINGVAIPDMYFMSGENIYAWLFLHTGMDDGETVYEIEIPIHKRSKTNNEPPTPVQQDIIEQAITLLDAGIEEVEQIASTINETIDTALQEAKDSGEFDGKDGKDGIDGGDHYVCMEQVYEQASAAVPGCQPDSVWNELTDQIKKPYPDKGYGLS